MTNVLKSYIILGSSYIRKGGVKMGQTDSQFKAFIRVMLETLKEIYSENPNEKLKKLIDNLQKTLED